MEPPVDLFAGEEPRAMIRRCGRRWEAWVEHGLLRYAGQYGTYARSEKGATRKALWLLRKYRDGRPEPAIEVSNV